MTSDAEEIEMNSFTININEGISEWIHRRKVIALS